MARIHQAEVTIGPLAEYEGRGDPSQGLRVYSAGRTQDIRIQFSVTKTIGGAPNQLDLILTNLQESTRNRIRQRLTRVAVSAGYLEGAGAGLRRVATGGVLSSVPSREGTEIITTVAALDGLGGISRGVYRKSFGPKVPLSVVVSGIARSMPGVEVGPVLLPGALGISGRTFAGRSAELLDDLADQWGFSWSVQNGVFQAVEDTKSLTTLHTLSWRDGTLREARPLLSGPMQVQTGVEVLAPLDPRIKPGDLVKIESRINPSLNRVYTVHEHDMAGDTHGDDWSTTIRSLFL